jgi:CRISPR-associated protein Cmr6
MRQCLRNSIGREIPDHLGLAYDAWAPTENNDGKVSDDNRRPWLDKLANLAVSQDYVCSFERWKASFTSPGDRLAEFTLTSRLLLGHGNASAVDVGLTVHHTWGVPFIPGSALKGLVAHYVDATYGPDDASKAPWEQQGDERARSAYQGVTWNCQRIERGPGAVYRALFGSPDASEDATMRENGLEAGAAAGLVTFHDALYMPGSIGDNKPFAADVLTVHQKSYYDSAGQTPPNDYDSPNPVAFLTVRPKCRFLLALSGPSEWTELAARLLADALGNWGVGGKTAAGYGFGEVNDLRTPPPRRTKTEQVIADLSKHPKDTLFQDIERWLQGEAVVGPMRALLSEKPGVTVKEGLDVVKAIDEKFNLRTTWDTRLKNRNADDQKKARARRLIEEWDKLFTKGGRT